MDKKVAIIGAGVSGITLARALLKKNINITIFESNPYSGGQWHYNPSPACVDIRKSQPVMPSAMYNCMRTNFPISMMQMPEHTYPDLTPTFPSHREVLNYIHSYITKFGLEKYIKYNKKVVNINKKALDWIVETKDGSINEFNYIAICTGKQCAPYIPKLTGMDTFSGIIMHSNSYRTPDAFKGQNVVVVGASYSGQEISTDLSNTAKHVYFCGQFKENNYSCPRKDTFYGKHNNIKQYPCIDSVSAADIKLKDGEILKQIDAIVLCTGYDYSFPFLRAISGDIQTSGKYIGPLYLDIFYPKNPSLMFIGLPLGATHFHVVSLQSAYCAKVINDEVSLPSYDLMLSIMQKHLKSLKRNGMTKDKLLKYGSRQHDYHLLLCRLANIKYSGEIKQIRTAFSEHKRRYQSDYRNKPFTPGLKD